jgi:7-carboxy-7-deazaguanine synthase
MINMGTVRLFETFTSIQGESTYAGVPCFFIRLAGCNLRCFYCDTVEAQAQDVGKDTEIAAIVEEACESTAAIIEITGGEPLIQPGFAELASELHKKGKRPVLVETNGSVDISVVPEGVIAIMDIKCPGSGEMYSSDFTNFARLRPYDEVKFVISDRNDYDWARGMVQGYRLSEKKGSTVLFSPVLGKLEPAELGHWILNDGLKVRLHAQLHKLMAIK